MSTTETPPTATELAEPRTTPWFFWPSCAALTALYFAVALTRISNLALLDPDEPRYAGAGRTMAQGGSLLVPEFNGAPRINKPPLFYWLVALSDKLSGDATESSARAPSVVMGLLMLWGTIWLGRRAFGHVTGLLAGLVLATMPLFMGLSRCCITDMTLSTFLAGAFAWLLLSMTGLSPPSRAAWIAAVLLGLAVLTKAHVVLSLILSVIVARALALPKESRPAIARRLPWLLLAAVVCSAIALQFEIPAKKKTIAAKVKAAAAAPAPDLDELAGDVPPDWNYWHVLDVVFNSASILVSLGVVALLAWMAYRAERSDPELPPMWKWGLLLAIAMGIWWYALLGWNQLANLWHTEINKRVAGEMHREGMHYYFGILPALTFPWSLGLPAILAAAWPDSGGAQQTLERRADSFLLAWLLGVVFFFSIPGAKLATYVLPAAPALALLTARFFTKLHAAPGAIGRGWLRSVQFIALAAGLALLVFPLALAALPETAAVFVHELLGSEKNARLWVLALIAALVFPGAWLLAISLRTRIAPMLLGAGAFALILAAARPAVDFLNPRRSTKQVCVEVEDKIRDCTRVVAMGVHVEGLSYYLSRRIDDIDEFESSHSTARERDMQFVLKVLGEKEPRAMFIDKRYFARIFGARTLTPADIEKKLPPNLTYVFSNQNVLVLRNKVAANP